MDIAPTLFLLGGLSPRQFMKQHWQKKPLLVRGALPGFSPLLARSELFNLAARDDVESRLVAQKGDKWQFRRGPFARRALPPLTRPAWSLLVQGVDLHHQGAHELLQQFRFVPQARLDDLMISYATDGGGVGAHFDSYDVFLLQAQGQRRWRIGRQKDLSLRAGVPLKILNRFEPEQEYLLNPGDMLYLPPRYAHDGVAIGECQTYSIGFRSPSRGELAHQLLVRLADDAQEEVGEGVYSDPDQAATLAPGEIPVALQRFAQAAVQAVLKDPLAMQRSLGEYLTEPKASVWFEPGSSRGVLRAVVLDRRTSMMYDARHIFVNGDSYLASGRDAGLMRLLADQRHLNAADLARAGLDAMSLLRVWREAGWLHPGKASR